jgi:hypothetical protein
MSLFNIVPVALTMVNTDDDILEHVDATKITFSRGVQGVSKPYIILTVGAADYESTTGVENASAAYRIDYNTYADTSRTALRIHDLIKERAKTYTNNDYDIRLFDEDYFVDVDGVHRATISVVFRTNLTQAPRSR